jgi:predicted tellurium resistance membrane protein TerC
MSKALELVGFALIGGTIISFMGMSDSELRWPVFWGCAIGALAIIFYRKRQRKKQDQNLSK